ncbi:uncharacterized protein HD556DRAFT_1451852 [Suillus plorans]|uniref:Uncharacterized protein n=1 Tax=Suillus plorans TaxID=116603 RepID=A0A9P7A8C8_9AGAM|nr:uncharacterized protein HD556DRAFT_1451852 [Suillus plorans]KAG1784369.1 hypothetical protein HD556DRAFT_1451852 [Suillus plorans]
MPNNIEASVIVPLKNSGFSKILDHLEKGAVAETAILSPDHFLEISDILGQSDVNFAASASLVIDIIRTTRHLEISVNCEDLDPATRALIVLEDQKKIRAMALHLLPDNFSELVDIAKKRTAPASVDDAEDTDTILESVQTLCAASAAKSDPTTYDEEYYELLVDWEKNHIALEELIAKNPAPRSPTPIDTRSTTATPDEETRERVLS